MMGGVIEGGIALLVAIFGGIFIFGQLRENARKNERDIEAIRKALVDGQDAMRELLVGYQADMKATIEKYQEDMKDLLDEEKSNSRESLTREVAHIRETLSMTINEIREDIRRLEQNQNENAKLREEVILLRQSVKSLHKRMDIEVPDSIRSHED